MVISRLFTSSLLLLASTVAAAVTVAQAPLSNEQHTRIFNPDFRTLQTKINGSDMQAPVITLDGADVLEIHFDELADQNRYLRFRLVHCNAFWQPDQLIESEYMASFNEATIDDYRYSQATLTHYVHYTITIDPQSQMRPLLSGNYLVQVFDESDPDTILLQSRFSVVEPHIVTNARLSSRTDVDTNEEHQQLSIAITPDGINLENPMANVIVRVTQNSRIDNVVTLRTPSRMDSRTLVYDHNPLLIFPAGNEYRRMEVVSTRYPGMGVATISFAHPYYHALLATDTPRAKQSYAYDRTQHGRFRIRDYDSDDSDTEAEYVVVHFSLEAPYTRRGNYYLDGDFTNRLFNSDSQLIFNPATGLYEAALLLKQGAYNYQYLYLPNGSQKASTAEIEGNKYQTTNEYLIYTYYRPHGARYDRLIGVAQVATNSK